MSHLTIDRMLELARAGLRRIYAWELPEALARGALVIERNVLEWRLDPSSSARLALATDHDVEWIVVCSEGYTSSLAAASLQQLGLHRATDLVGGYQALKAAGLLTVASRTPHFAREVASLAAL